MELPVDAWILTIGNEIVNGVITDTNREAISRELRMAGITVKGMTSVGDDTDLIADALRSSLERARLLVACGGLGPTEDDKTSHAVAKFLDTDLETDKEQLAVIEERFHQWGRPMSPSNAKQAMFPSGALPIPNDYGTAPGFMIRYEDRMAMFFPGVPRELIRMLRERGMPMIAERFGTSVRRFLTKTLKVYGLTESKLGEILQDLAQDEEDFHLAFLPRFPIIRLRIDVSGKPDNDLERVLENKQRLIEDRIKENIISDDGRNMEVIVLELLQSKGWTLGLAESITGGMIGDMITRVPGASSTYQGSIVSYSNDMKEQILGVDPSVIRNHGAVSHQCASEMAQGARRACRADVALSVTGIAGPGGGTAEKPVGTFFVGTATPETVMTRGFLLPGQREWVRTLAAMQTLDLLRRHLLGFRLHGDTENEVGEELFR
jgi:nicotinamide-nucleotide amidase